MSVYELVQEKYEATERLQPGSNISFQLFTPVSDQGERLVQSTILATHGGGFYGRVLELDNDLVVKTAQTDPWHEFLRSLNWRGPFPPQVDAITAQHDHLTSKLIHQILPYITKGIISSPDSLGYTFLPGVGYAQVLQKMKGRSPRFDREGEVEKVRAAQAMLLELGTVFGLEQIGQIHPDNPFAFANLWIGEDGNVIWLDALPAFKHTGFVWPAFKFDFHYDIRNRFLRNDPTFNKIHTDRFRKGLSLYSNLIPEGILSEILIELDYYDDILKQQEERNDRAPSFSAGYESLTDQSAPVLAAHQGKLESYLDTAAGIISPLAVAATERVRNKMQEFIRDEQSSESVLFTYFNSKYLQERAQDYLLSGVRNAYSHGLLSEDELQEIEMSLSLADEDANGKKRRNLIYAELGVSYLVASYLINAVETSAYIRAFFVDNKAATIVFGIFIGRVLPLLIKPTITALFSAGSGYDLRAAGTVSLAPLVGSYLAIPAQMVYDNNSKSEIIWHYTVRNIIAKLSAVMKPWGGWGSEHEAELMEKQTELLEKLGPLFNFFGSNKKNN